MKLLQFLLCCWFALSAQGCATDAGTAAGRNSSGAGGSPDTSYTQGNGGSTPTGMGGSPLPPPPKQCNPCEDFPAAPIFMPGTPANAPTLFGDASNVAMNGGPCIAEPEDGTLLPLDWLRPRIRWTGTSDLYEVRLSTPRQKNDLVVYTTDSEYYVPRDIWAGSSQSQGLALNDFEEDITVTVRGVSLGGGTPVGSSVKFRSAAVKAGGALVYCSSLRAQVADTIADGDAAGWLSGFNVGDEGSADVLRVTDVATPERGYDAAQAPVTCIGCHTPTPDGNAVSFTGYLTWSGGIADITQANLGKLPASVTPSGLTALQQIWMGGWSYSKGQWRPGYEIAIASYGAATLGWPEGNLDKSNHDNLLWMNIAAPAPASIPTNDSDVRTSWTPLAQGTALGIIARNGDTRAALMPDFSHSGASIVYTSSSASQDGRIAGINDTDVYMVPFNNGLGGNATPLPGASAKGVAEYYPNYSADDAFVAFNRIDNVMNIVKPNGIGFENHLYYRPEGEIWITPTPGSNASAAPGEVTAGSAIRLKANDPNACSGKKSPGVLNSWARFSPSVSSVSGKTYYFVVFSSTRDTPDAERTPLLDKSLTPVETLYSRLFMAAFSVEGGKVTTYPAVYLWNQGETSSNLTPSWANFNLPAMPLPATPR